MITVVCWRHNSCSVFIRSSSDYNIQVNNKSIVPQSPGLHWQVHNNNNNNNIALYRFISGVVHFRSSPATLSSATLHVPSSIYCADTYCTFPTAMRTDKILPWGLDKCIIIHYLLLHSKRHLRSIWNLVWSPEYHLRSPLPYRSEYCIFNYTRTEFYVKLIFCNRSNFLK